MKAILSPKNINSTNDLKVFFLEGIQSTQPGHREKLREVVFNTVSQDKPQVERTTLCDLGSIPKISGGALSLSHSRQGSGFCYAMEPIKLGIDIEEIERLKPQLINRVSDADERNNCPNPQWLFSAKEASWKALNHTFKVPTISHIETYLWKQEDQTWSSFMVKLNDKTINGQGFIREISGTYLSFYLAP